MSVEVAWRALFLELALSLVTDLAEHVFLEEHSVNGRKPPGVGKDISASCNQIHALRT
jgi:hypothetical protein